MPKNIKYMFMKKSFLIFLAIAFLLSGLFFSCQNYENESVLENEITETRVRYGDRFSITNYFENFRTPVNEAIEFYLAPTMSPGIYEGDIPYYVVWSSTSSFVTITPLERSNGPLVIDWAVISFKSSRTGSFGLWADVYIKETGELHQSLYTAVNVYEKTGNPPVIGPPEVEGPPIVL